MSVAIVSIGAVSAQGRGSDAYSCGKVGSPAQTCVARDASLVEAGLVRPYAARVSSLPEGDRASALLREALEECLAELKGTIDLSDKRIALFVGTSSGGMQSFEAALDGRAGARLHEGMYVGPLRQVLGDLSFRGPWSACSLVLGACASSTFALGLGMRSLELGECDVAIAGGFDAVSVFVASGFEVLRATTREGKSSPFRVGRDGMSLGEGAAFAALVRSAEVRRAYAFLHGFGAASDAVHLTAPDREGGGIFRAAQLALTEAGLTPFDLVSAHATATPFNDASEARGIRRAIALASGVNPSGDGTANAAADPVVHPFKAQIGHTLGAAGILETLAAVDAVRRGVLPAAYGEGAIDEDARVNLLSHTASTDPRGAPPTALKLSSAFGGANAALVVGAAPRAPGFGGPRARGEAYASRGVYVGDADDVAALARATGYSRDKLARADRLTRLVIAAVQRLQDQQGDLRGAGIIVGHGLATMETNATYWQNARSRPSHAEPRRFPYTSPNAAPGECSVVFGLSGPSFAVGAGMHGGIEALLAARTLVRAGDSERVVVVAVDESGPWTRRLSPHLRDGAVATLVSRPAGWAMLGAGESGWENPPAGVPVVSSAHEALLPLTEEGIPERLAAASPWGGFAHLSLVRV